MKVRWRDSSGEEREEDIRYYRIHMDGREVAQDLAERAHHESGSEAYRQGGSLEILDPPELRGSYRIEVDYDPVFTAFKKDP